MSGSRRAPWLGLLGLALLLAGCGGGGPPERVILIVIDTLRRDYVGVYGGKTPTPNLDRLAQEGQALERAYSAYHQTTMSMASLFTGELPSLETDSSAVEGPSQPWNGRTWCGLVRFAAPEEKACVPASLPTLAERFGEYGFETLAVVTNELLFDPAGYSRGFDVWEEIGGGRHVRRAFRPVPGDPYQRGAKYALEALESVLATRTSDRFFLYVHLMDTHDYSFKGAYEIGVSEADDAVGAIRARLEQDGLFEDALVVVTSDHGERLGEQQVLPGSKYHFGNPSFETLVSIPLIVRPSVEVKPEQTLRGDQFKAWLVGHALGAEAAADVERLLFPDEVFLSERAWWTYSDGRYKSFRKREDGPYVLVDLERDPDEMHDLATELPDVLTRHRERTSMLARQLGTGNVVQPGLSDADRERLRALGYLD